MKRLLLFTLALVLAGVPAGTATAASPRLPVSLYPGGAAITYRPTVSNQRMDCLWGYFCDGGVPLFHDTTQDELHRSSGWAQFAGVHRNGRLAVAFELFASRYESGLTDEDVQWASAALDDFQSALREHGYRAITNPPLLLKGDASGAQTVEQSGRRDMVAMGAWSGSVEVEAIVAFYSASPSTRRATTHLLARQVQLALTVTP